MTKKTVISKGVTFGSLFKIFFLGLFFSLGIPLLVLGVLAMLGNHIFFWDNQVILGLKGLLFGIVLAPSIAITMGFLLSAIVGFGLWLYTRLFFLRVTFKLRSSFSDD